MGLLVLRWENSVDDGDGIYYGGADGLTLFEVMEEYLTHGQTMEILKYDLDTPAHQPLANPEYIRDLERIAHGEEG